MKRSVSTQGWHREGICLDDCGGVQVWLGQVPQTNGRTRLRPALPVPRPGRQHRRNSFRSCLARLSRHLKRARESTKHFLMGSNLAARGRGSSADDGSSSHPSAYIPCISLVSTVAEPQLREGFAQRASNTGGGWMMSAVIRTDGLSRYYGRGASVWYDEV